jgi:hypothetical protein
MHGAEGNPTASIFHMTTRRNSDGVKPVTLRNTAENGAGFRKPDRQCNLRDCGTRQQGLCPFDAAGNVIAVRRHAETLLERPREMIGA